VTVEAAAVSYLNQHTRAVLELVRKGRTVEITERGTPIARIVPIRPALTGVAARLVAEGRAQAPQRDRPLPWAAGPVDPTGAGGRTVSELREDERY
jgi:prevent-host-death family protein